MSRRRIVVAIVGPPLVVTVIAIVLHQIPSAVPVRIVAQATRVDYDARAMPPHIFQRLTFARIRGALEVSLPAGTGIWPVSDRRPGLRHHAELCAGATSPSRTVLAREVEAKAARPVSLVIEAPGGSTFDVRLEPDGAPGSMTLHASAVTVDSERRANVAARAVLDRTMLRVEAGRRVLMEVRPLDDEPGRVLDGLPDPGQGVVCLESGVPLSISLSAKTAEIRAVYSPSVTEQDVFAGGAVALKGAPRFEREKFRGGPVQSTILGGTLCLTPACVDEGKVDLGSEDALHLDRPEDFVLRSLRLVGAPERPRFATRAEGRSVEVRTSTGKRTRSVLEAIVSTQVIGFAIALFVTVLGWTWAVYGAWRELSKNHPEASSAAKGETR